MKQEQAQHNNFKEKISKLKSEYEEKVIRVIDEVKGKDIGIVKHIIDNERRNEEIYEDRCRACSSSNLHTRSNSGNSDYYTCKSGNKTRSIAKCKFKI